MERTLLLLTGLLFLLTPAAQAAPTCDDDPTPPPPPIQVTYSCKGTAKAYFRRAIYDAGQGFAVTGAPKIENTELAILNAQGLPEFLIHPDLAECGCLPDDQIYFQHFGPTGVLKWYAKPGHEHFALSDGSGTLDCDITLTGLN